jgi:hypothetical protein
MTLSVIPSERSESRDLFAHTVTNIISSEAKNPPERRFLGATAAGQPGCDAARAVPAPEGYGAAGQLPGHIGQGGRGSQGSDFKVAIEVGDGVAVLCAQGKAAPPRGMGG